MNGNTPHVDFGPVEQRIPAASMCKKSLLMVSRASAWKAEAPPSGSRAAKPQADVFQCSLPGAHATNAHVALRLKAYT
jgi:hypothetical protein